MKVKAYFLIILVIISLLFLVIYPAQSGTTTPVTQRTVVYTSTQTVNTSNTVTNNVYGNSYSNAYQYLNNTVTHRVVAGTARGGGSYSSIWNRFLNSNGYYWSGVYGYAANFSQAEINFMNSLYLAGGCHNQYVDLTGHTWGQIFEGSSSDGSVHGFQTDLHKVFPDYTTSSSSQTGYQYNGTALTGTASNTTHTYSETSEVIGSNYDGWEQGENGEIIEIIGVDLLKTITDLATTTISNYFTNRYVNTITNTNTNHTYQIVGYFCESPLVLDLDNNRLIDTARNEWMPHNPKFFTNYARFFDITGDGEADFCEWIAPSPKDALLVMPVNGKVEGALQCFGTAGGYTDGYEKLSLVCDKDNNGWIENEELKGLMLWKDENNDAICQDSELKQLSDYNIVKLSSKHNNYVSSYVTSDGSTHTMWDWWPTLASTRKFRN